MTLGLPDRLGGGRFEAESANPKPGRLNPAVVPAMAEVGIDISRNATKSVEALLREGRRYDVAVTVCDGANAERCPVLLGACDTQALDAAHSARDAIRERVRAWIAARTGAACVPWPGRTATTGPVRTDSAPVSARSIV